MVDVLVKPAFAIQVGLANTVLLNYATLAVVITASARTVLAYVYRVGTVVIVR